MDKHKNANYGIALVRVVLGLLFLVPGIMKLTNPQMIIGMLEGIGFPVAALFGWLVIIFEILCGIALIVGWKTKWAVWPVIVIMIVATIIVAPGQLAAGNPSGLLFHLLAIAGLVMIFLTGAGAVAVSKE